MFILVKRLFQNVMGSYISEATLDSLLEGFQVIDFQWRYVYVNKSVAIQGKSSRDEMIGKTMMEKYPGIESTPLFDILQKCMKERCSEYIENEFKYADGTTGWFELRIQPVPEGLFILSADITERKKSELALRNLNDSLESQVAERTSELTMKNKDLIDSLAYARLIQQSRLPSREDISSILPQNFILYKPKEIVSGDFYFFQQSGSTVYLACADCTGHGIPGAMMSMLGSEKLEKSLAHHGDVSHALSYLNREVKKSLKQSRQGNSIHDGMDIGICSLYRSLSMGLKDGSSTITLEYASANRPLWIIRKDAAELEIIKPTRRAIGGHTPDDQLFDKQTVQLNSGDTFYLFSDGYSDSFGGRLGKKLMLKRFRDLLFSIQDLSMKDQEIYLDNFIENWKGDSEQIDDILVIGVRI